MAASWQSYLDFAVTLADEAGKIMLEGFHGSKHVEEKNGNSWDLVTDYDKRVEENIMATIKSQYPTHLILAEEDSSTNKKSPELTDAPTWIIDPIDGTYNYVHGLPFTCISIALAIDRNVVVGVVYNPISGDKYTAVRNGGAYLNGNRIQVSRQQKLDEAIVSFEIMMVRVPHLTEKYTNRCLHIAKRVNGVRSIGSAALTLCLVASGGIDAYFQEYIQAWDMAAGVLLIEEAGGYVCSFSGDKHDLMGRNIIATSNKKLADDVLAVFAMFP